MLDETRGWWMSRVKYQVFVSSTYEDLRDERDAVVKAILGMGHIPVGMEMFAASDEEQWKIIARHVEESDYYVVIVGHRYGSTTSEGVSYTEKEYDHAVATRVPVLGFVIDTDVPRTTAQMESTDVGRAALAAFVEKVKQKPVKFWRGPGDLGQNVLLALLHAHVTNPRPGWTRVVPGDEKVAGELARLSSENAELRAKLSSMDPDAALYRRVDAAIDEMKSRTLTIDLQVTGLPQPERHETTLYALFDATCLKLMVPIRADTLGRALARAAMGESVAGGQPEATVSREDSQGILMTLAAVGMVDPVAGLERGMPFWQLSARGREVFEAIYVMGTDDEEAVSR